MLGRYGRPNADDGWHFLTGDEASIHKLTEAVGFRYHYDPETGEFGHATGILLLTPAGKVSRYYYGIDFSPRDLRLGLIEAADAQIGTPIDQLLLFCFHYDPVTGKYGLLVSNLIRGAGILTVLLLAGFVIAMLRRERASRRTASAMSILAFPLFPAQASTMAERVDQLYFFLLGISVFFAGLICILIIVFAIKYRRRSTTSSPGRSPAIWVWKFFGRWCRSA